MASKAEVILIRFSTQALDRARKVADDIDKKIKAAARGIKDLAVRNKFLGKQAVLQQERREDIRRQDFSIRARQLAAQEAANFSAGIRRRGNDAKEFFERANRVVDVAQAGNLAGALNLLGRVPVVGQVAAVAGAVASVVLPLLQRDLDAKLAAMENRIALRQQRIFRDVDVERRFREDIDFRDKVTRDAVREEMDRDAAMRKNGWRRRGRFTVPE